jgi:hypothetical protein
MNAENAVQLARESRVVNAGADTIMSVIARAASDPNTDVEKLERLAALYERIMAQNAKAAYTAALAEMQPGLPVIIQRGEIKHGENKPVLSTYAKWEDINEAIRPVLHVHGFALSFRTGQEGDRVKITAVLSHRDGHSEETTLSLPIDASGAKNNVQGVGSSTSYGKRYTACALLNITTRGEDDDGNRGGARGQSAAAEAATAAINACNTLEELRAWKVKNADSLVRLGSEADPIIKLFNQRVANTKARS